MRGSSDLHTSQLQVITGMPTEVPVPRNVTRSPEGIIGNPEREDAALERGPAVERAEPEFTMMEFAGRERDAAVASRAATRE